MLNQELQENYRKLLALIEEKPIAKTEQEKALLNYYIEQNTILINDIFSISIEKLTYLQKNHTVNDIICTQARLTSEITEKVTLNSRRFLDATLGELGDYNEWLKAHCDLATD